MHNLKIFNNKEIEKQVQPLFGSTLTGGLGNILAACLVYMLINDDDNHHSQTLIIITASIILFSIVRIMASTEYLKRDVHSHLLLYLVTHLSLTFIIGIAWGLATINLSPDDESVRNILFLIQFGLIAGSIATLSVWMPAYLAYMLPQSFAIFYVIITNDIGHNYYMAFAFAIFGLFMITTSFSVNKSHRQELLLKLKNSELIDDLSNEIVHRENIQILLEESKRDLEVKVDERTQALVTTNKDLQTEIKEKQQVEVNLEYMAYHDELTGLPNKALLIDRINQSIDSADRYEKHLGILFLDLDRFKNINDSLGHSIGDKLILEVSRRLIQTIRKEDTVSRYSGDEFVIIIQRMANSEEAVLVAKKIIKNLMRTFDIDSHKVRIGASIGISVYPHDANSPTDLIRNADTAMFKAKTAGGNRLQFYNESMSNSLTERLQIENELHTALSKNEFYLVYQPQVDCNTGKTVGFEALLRWNNNVLGAMSPSQFIPLLEETGLIYSVGEWVIKQVIQFLHTGQVGKLHVAINLSTLQCKDMSLIVLLQNEITKTGIDPAQIEFEITESLLINDFEKTEIFLNELHSIGCSIALDDFGTGYTSMSYLTRLPIDIIKLDKSFIRDINTNTTLFNIVKAIIKMSQSLGITNVFEGVETEGELGVIKHLQGNLIQGFFYSKPLPESEVSSWLTVNKNSKLKIV